MTAVRSPPLQAMRDVRASARWYTTPGEQQGTARPGRRRGNLCGSLLLAAALAGCGRAPLGSSLAAPAERRSDRAQWEASSQETAVFERLAREIGDARVVALGELTHYGAATFDHPLELSGMDPQLSGTAPRQQLVPRLEEQLGAPLAARQARAIEHLFSLDLERTTEERRTDRNALLALLGRVRQRTGIGSSWARVVDGLLYLDEDHWDYQFQKGPTIETEQLRNQQMGQNVLWWLSQAPEEKVLVWAASVHIARTHRGFVSPVATANGFARDNGVSAGQWLADSLGRGYFALAVSAATGSYGLASGAWSESLGPADPTMLEHAALGGALQLLPRAELLARGNSPALLMGGTADTAEWGQLFDAVLVFPRERPVAARAGCEG